MVAVGSVGVKVWDLLRAWEEWARSVDTGGTGAGPLDSAELFAARAEFAGDNGMELQATELAPLFAFVAKIQVSMVPLTNFASCLNLERLPKC